MRLPSEYVTWRSRLRYSEAAFGVGGVRVVSLEELDKFQVGYSRSPQGATLCGGSGRWQKEWVAIGHETAMGDPLILDTGSMRVLTAPHGEGEWYPECIATSLQGFEIALELVRGLSVGRANPVELEANPLKDTEREAALSQIAHANPDAEFSFWVSLLS